METLNEITESLLPRSERQRRALRNAIATRKLEQMREDKALHWFITDVWDEPASTSSKRWLAETDDSGVNHDPCNH